MKALGPRALSHEHLSPKSDLKLHVIIIFPIAARKQVIDKFLLVEGFEENLQCPDWAFSPTTFDCKKTTI